MGQTFVAIRCCPRADNGDVNRVDLVASLLVSVLALAPAIAVTRPGPIVVGRAPLIGVVIALDPGHNGGNASHSAEISKQVWIGNGYKPCNQVGTGTTSGYPEHAFTFDLALRVKASLESFGAKVYLTRTTDTGVGPCVDVRGRFGESVHADLAVSIHGDGSSSGNRGFFVMRPGLVTGYTDDILARSKVLATRMRDGLQDAGLPVANYYATNGLVTRTNLGTLNWSDVPIVMIELGNMKNASDASRMTSKIGRTQYANGIVFGIRAFLGR
jgi:N-acetylmuramoyl-L-alanine amidase